MEEVRVYQDLQKHLDRQPIGFPATITGAEIPLLKRFFSPQEARLAMHLSYKPSPAVNIWQAAKDLVISQQETEDMLDTMMKNGAVGHLEKEGVRYFYIHPLVVGIYEWQLNRLSPGLFADMGAYMSQQVFGREFLSTKVPQMRTIPIGKSIPVESHVMTYNNVNEIIKGNDGPIVILECICRKAAGLRGQNCKKTERKETCMALGDWAKNAIRAGAGRAIDKEEALEVMRQNQADGLILQPSNTQKVEFVCSCCGCCCGMLGIYKTLPKPVEFWSSNYFSEVNSAECSGCGTCVERCQMSAISLNEEQGIAVVNLDRCLGCGNCVDACPSEALHLVQKAGEKVPPLDTEDLYETVLTVKKRMQHK
jgi:electron transport complex protein RnfB